MTTITIAELLTDLSSLKACSPTDAIALVTVASSDNSNSMSIDEDADVVAAKELIALYKEIEQRRGLDGLEETRREVEGVVTRAQGA